MAPENTTSAASSPTTAPTTTATAARPATPDREVPAVAAGHRTDQHAEQQGERQDGRHGPAPRLAHGRGRDEPGEPGPEQDDGTGNGTGRPFVWPGNLAPVSATEPGEQPVGPRLWPTSTP